MGGATKQILPHMRSKLTAIAIEFEYVFDQHHALIDDHLIYALSIITTCHWRRRLISNTGEITAQR